MPSGRGRASVRFDESAFDDDVARLSARGREIVARAREEFEREGVSLSRLLACQDEHESGTSLPGCMKVYVPDAHGQWRIIFQIAAGDAGLLLSYLAAGVGHQPRGAGAPDAYRTPSALRSMASSPARVDPGITARERVGPFAVCG